MKIIKIIRNETQREQLLLRYLLLVSFQNQGNMASLEKKRYKSSGWCFANADVQKPVFEFLIFDYVDRDYLTI